MAAREADDLHHAGTRPQADGGHDPLADALRRSQEEHRIVLSSISDAVFITDDVGRFTFICPNVDVIFGYSYEEVQELGEIRRLIGDPPLDEQELRASGEIYNVEHTIINKHAQQRILLINVKRVAIRDGTRLYTCRDITKRKEMEESLEEYRAQLAHATRVSTVGVLSSGLAHELNQPLSAIANYASACVRRIERGVDRTDELRAQLKQITDQAHRAADIVQRLRAFARKRPTHRVVTEPCRIVQDALALVEPSVRRQAIEIRTELATDLPPLEVDELGIQQVLINLIRNATEALRRSDQSRGEIAVSVRRSDGDAVEFAVSDNGPGLPSEVLERVFDAFYTTRSDGMGLGLSISRAIIDAHDGRLWAARENGRGATFYFRLPTAASRGTLQA